MEELKELIAIVDDLPAMVLWVLAGYFSYKVLVLGSIYGLIKFIVSIAYKAYSNPKVITKEFDLDGIAINGAVAQNLVTQLRRLVTSAYLHQSSVDALQAALDAHFNVKKTQ